MIPKYLIPLILSIFILNLRRVQSVLSLQLPGLNFGTGDSTVVDIDFLDKSGSPIYVLKGEVFARTLPTRKINNFYPDGLTGSQKYASKIRFKAAEVGTTIKIFDSITSSMPNLTIFITSSFILPEDQAVEINFIDGEQSVQNDSKVDYTWYKRDKRDMSRMDGFHIARIEVITSRVDNAPLVAVPVFGAIGVDSINSPGIALNAAVGGASAVQSKNVAVLQSNQQIQPVQMAMINPPGSQLGQP